MKEMEVGFKDMALKVLLKWRMFLVCMIVVGMLFGGIGFIKVANSDNEEQIQEPVVITTLDTLKAPLTESTQKSIELAVENYMLLQELIKEKEVHQNHSIRMKADYQSVSEMTITYRIDSKAQAVYPIVSVDDITTDIIDLYLRRILSNDTYELIIAETGWNIDTGCVRELISTEKGAKELFTVHVMACNQEECTKMISAIKNRVANVTQDISKDYGEFNITIVSEIYNEKVNTDLLREKQNRNNEIISIRNEMEAMDDAFSPEGMAYFDALLNGVPEDPVAQENVEDVKSNTQTNPKTSTTFLKYVLLGLVIGAGLVFIYVVFLYVCSSRLHCDEELNQLANVTVLGSIYKGNTKKKFLQFIDDYIYKMFGNVRNNKEEQIELICSNIHVSMKKQHYSKVCLATSCNDETVENIMEELSKKLQSNSNEVYTSMNVLRNAEMLEKMLLADCVVIVEKENVSKQIDVKRTVELCSMHQVHPLGGVFINDIS